MDQQVVPSSCRALFRGVAVPQSVTSGLFPAVTPVVSSYPEYAVRAIHVQSFG